HSCWSAWSPWMPSAGGSSLLFAVSSWTVGSGVRERTLAQAMIDTVTWTEFTTKDDGVLVAGRRAGIGQPVLLLHGGPGLGFDYLRDLANELAQENEVAWYQQRGLAPSAAEGPYTVATDVGDARRVLDALG